MRLVILIGYMYENSLFGNLNFQGQFKVKKSNLIIAQQSYENDSCLKMMLVSRFFLHSALFSLFPLSVSFSILIFGNGIRVVGKLSWQDRGVGKF